MLTPDEQLAILQQLTYSDSRKVKESRRGKKFFISKQLFLQVFYGKTNKIKREVIDDFFTKVKATGTEAKMRTIFALNHQNMSDVKLRPISPKLRP